MARVFVVLIFVNEGRQVAFLVKRDDCQVRVARQGEVLGDIHPPVTVAIFLPHAVVAFVMVAVLSAPMPSDGASKIPVALRFHARNEVTDALVNFSRLAHLFPLATHFDNTPGGDDAHIFRMDGPTAASRISMRPCSPSQLSAKRGCL